MYFPEELWNMVIDFTLNFKKSHKMNLEPSLKLIEGMYDSFRYEWSMGQTPPDKVIVLEEIEVPLVSISWDPENKLWIYGYGWCKYYLEN